MAQFGNLKGAICHLYFANLADSRYTSIVRLVVFFVQTALVFKAGHLVIMAEINQVSVHLIKSSVLKKSKPSPVTGGILKENTGVSRIMTGLWKRFYLHSPAKTSVLTPHYRNFTHLKESLFQENIVQKQLKQELLGHASSKTTEIYTHVSNKNLSKIKSPLDNLKL